MTIQHTFADGKYTIINDNGKLTALRYGEPWDRDLTGDNLVYWMLVEVDRLKAALQAKEEPVAWEHLKPYGYAPGGYMMTCRGCNTTVFDVDKRAAQCRTCAEAMYAKKQQRKPLTDEEIWACLPKDPDEMAFARAIEAAHGIKE